MMVKNENANIKFDTATNGNEMQTKMNFVNTIPSDYQDYTESSDIMDISSYTTSGSVMQALVTTAPYSTPMLTTPLTTPTSLGLPWGLYSGADTTPVITSPMVVSLPGGDQSYLHGGSFAPPVVASPSHRQIRLPATPTSYSTRSYTAGTRAGAGPSTATTARSSPTTGRRRLPDSQFPPEEREKRRLRRERNKVAAAKCRQRRVDQTNTLLEETEEWEDKNANLESEISKLQQQKEQLQFVLEAHKANCKMSEGQGGARSTHSAKRPAKATPFPSTSGLHTPITEVVTPTSGIFNFEPLQPSCSVEAAKADSSSDLSSPDSAKLVSL